MGRTIAKAWQTSIILGRAATLLETENDLAEEVVKLSKKRLSFVSVYYKSASRLGSSKILTSKERLSCSTSVLVYPSLRARVERSSRSKGYISLALEVRVESMRRKIVFADTQMPATDNSTPLLKDASETNTATVFSCSFKNCRTVTCKAPVT